MTMRKVICWFWILVVGVCCGALPARGSLILDHANSSLTLGREEMRNERLYEQIVAQRSENPTRFDHLHPILGNLLTKQSSFEYWLNRWQAAPARFEHWHPMFWRIIAGESLAGGPPVTPPPIPPLIPPSDEGGNPPVGPGPPTPAPPAPPAAVTVPEPGTCLLLLEALGLILLARGAHGFLRSR
jgi:hypothetical protein